MLVKCSDCGGRTTWDADAGSAICLVCGTLVDSSQSVLASQIDEDSGTFQSNRAGYQRRLSVKSVHGNSTFELSGQQKEARDAKNTVRLLLFSKLFNF